MDKDENNYWHLRTPYDTKAIAKLVNSQDQLTPRKLGQLYVNSFLGSSIAETCVFSIDAKKTTQFTGFSTMLTRNLVFHSSRVLFYDMFRRRFTYIDTENQEMISIPAALLCGGAAGFIAQGLYSFHDFFRSYLKLEKPRASVFKVLQGKAGLNRLLAELGARGIHACLWTAGDVATYDLCKRHLKKQFQCEEDLPIHFASALLAGLVASLLSHPADVVRRRVLTQLVGKGLFFKATLEVLVDLVRNEGAHGLYKNFVPCLQRLGAWSVVFWLSVEQLRLWEGQAGF